MIAYASSRFHIRVREASTKTMSTEARLRRLEYVVQVYSSKIETLEVQMREALDETKRNDDKTVTHLRDMGLILLDMDFIRDNLKTILDAFHH